MDTHQKFIEPSTFRMMANTKQEQRTTSAQSLKPKLVEFREAESYDRDYEIHNKLRPLITSNTMETRYYEGCRREGPIRCIFLGEFHPVAGPKISCQFPEDYVSKELFDAISGYIIPKPQIPKSTMTINALGHKIVGYPIRIDSTRYERNMYMFNLCFVCDSWSVTVQYEPVVKKLGEHLTLMEEETGFVSSGSTRLPTLLAHLMHDLNTFRRATLVEGETVMHLKVLEVRKDPVAVRDHDVPVLVAALGLPRPRRAPRRSRAGDASRDSLHDRLGDDEPVDADEDADWDLTTRQLLPHINGYNHVLKISSDANVEKNLVKSCLQNLVYYRVVMLIPVLKFSNMYRATPQFSRLFSDPDLQKSCIAYISNGGGSKEKPSISLAASLLCALQQGATLRAVCERHAGSLCFDVRRLVVFALMHGLIRCLRRFPVYICNNSRPNGFGSRLEVPGLGPAASVRRLITGRHSVDEICCLARVDLPSLEQIIEEDPNIATIWR